MCISQKSVIFPTEHGGSFQWKDNQRHCRQVIMKLSTQDNIYKELYGDNHEYAFPNESIETQYQ
jgi:hypothetical protein